MASFNTAYGLCPIIDQRGLLGVSYDEKGCAVVTIGKNMVIRCRLGDQKQLSSWSTTLAKLTSKVVYNDGSYTGIFDDVCIKQWDKYEPSLEKIKKCKLHNEIHEILLYKKSTFLKPKPVVLFKNGSSMSLNLALENRKIDLPGILATEDIIQAVNFITHDGQDYLTVISKSKNKQDLCYSALLKSDTYEVVADTVKKTKLQRQGAALLGHCIFLGEKGNFLLTFWSDSFLYSLPIPVQADQCGAGRFIGTMDSVSRNSEVAMLAISNSHIAIYAGDPTEEGAILGIYNVNFGMMQAQTKFKMFNKPPRMWLVENSLIIVMGQRLVCVPFNIQAETLSSLVGSKPLFSDAKAPSDISSIMPTATWEGNSFANKTLDDNFPSKIKEQLSAFSFEGWSEAGICRCLLSQLIEQKDLITLYWCLDNFIDVPEDLLVKLTTLTLTESDSVFPDSFALEMVDGMRHVNGWNEPEESKNSNPLTPDSRAQFLNKILTVSVNTVNLLDNLRRHLRFEEGLLLLRYLCFLVYSKNDESDLNVINWTVSLIDAFYQQFILSRDNRVLEMILLLGEIIDVKISALNEIKNLAPILLRLNNNKELFKNQGHSKSYSVERFKLYQ